MLGGVASGLGAAIGQGVTGARDLELPAGPPVTTVVLGAAAAGALCAAIGVGVGFARPSVPAIVTVIVWAIQGENMVSLIVPGPYLPVGAARILGGEQLGEFALWATAVVLTVYPAAALGAGWRRLQRDIEA